MSRIINPREYRYILGDFVRSGIHIKYEKVSYKGAPSTVMIDGKEITTYPEYKTIYFPYISGRQYQIYKEYHFVASENDSWEYRILGEVEAGDIGEYEIDEFNDWKFFCEAFNVTDSDFHNDSNYCYAFIFDYNVRFLDLPLSSNDIITKDMIDESELVELLTEIGALNVGESINDESHAKVTPDEDIQKKHIFELYENYTRQKPFYPLSMSLEWFYLIDGQRLNIDTILNSVLPINNICPDQLIANYIIDYAPHMSEEDLICAFKCIRDRYAQKVLAREEEWYAHTAVLMDEILKLDVIEHVAKKIRKVRAFCNNHGVNLYETAKNNIPYFTRVLSKYQKSVEKIYKILIAENYIDEQTRLSDFKYYMTGELETEIHGKIYWKGELKDLIDFLLCILGDRGEWKIASQICVTINGKSPTTDTFKSMKSQYFDAHTDKFEMLFK